MSVASLNILLEKTGHWDKDERYMATNDLCSALSKDIKIDESMEQRICAAVLKQLDDQSNDVQSVAVKCLAIILKKVQKGQVGEICKKLCSLILDGNDALRDIYSIGLKTLIADVPDSMGSLIVEKLTSNLLTGIARPGGEDVKRECLDIMSDLLKRFGSLNEKDHIEIMTAVVAQLEHDRPVIRKRATNCLGSLAVVSTDALLNRLVQTLLERIEQAEKKVSASSSQATRTLIQTIGTVSRMVGHRLGRHLDRIVPLFLRFCGDPDDDSHHNDAANELRENCFPGLESFVLRCPREVAPFLPNILQVSVAFMKYDPNYAYDDDDEGEDLDGGGEAGDSDRMDEGDEDSDAYAQDEDYGGGGNGSDDDDTSWKVRKAAVKVIDAVVSSRPEGLPESGGGLYDAVGDALISRFKEREENVRLDIVTCFAHLVQVTCCRSAASAVTPSATQFGAMPAAPLLKRQRSTVGQLESRLQRIVSASLVQLAGSSLKTKSSVFNLLRIVVVALDGGLGRFVPKLLSAAHKCLLEKNQALKLDAMAFIRLTLEHHSPDVLQPSLPQLLPLVVSVLAEDWYKIIAEALRVLGAIILVARPRDPLSGQFLTLASAVNYRPLVPVLFGAISSRLEALDIDQEIKECAVGAMGRLISHMGDELQPAQLNSVLDILQRRMENETTRSATLKAVMGIAGSPLEIDLSSFVAASVKDLALYLRQNSRILQQLTLQTLDALVLAASVRLNADMVGAILQEAHVLVNETDLHLTHLTLRLTKSLLQKDAAASAQPIAMFMYARLVEVARSSLVQGVAQQSLIALFHALSAAGLPQMKFSDIFSSLYSSPAAGGAPLAKQGVSNLSKCIAAAASAPGLSATVLSDTIDRLIADVRDRKSSEQARQIALLTLGELGQVVDLSQRCGASVQGLVLESFESTVEETKLAAAYALGHIAVGNMGVFLPVALQSAHNIRHQYLLLAALKEIVVVFANQSRDFSPYLGEVLPVLLEQCRSEEESVRNMVAECLGVLTSMIAAQIVPVLLDLCTRDVEDKLSRRMIASTLRFALSRSHTSSENLSAIAAHMDTFLSLLEDSDLDVQRDALLMVNTAVHHNPSCLEAHLSCRVVPMLLGTLKIRLERTVDLGPFKHKVDDNLPQRKVALTCVDTVLEVLPQRMDVVGLMQAVPLLLTDKDEIKLQVHQILCKLTRIAPTAVAGFVESLVDPLDKIVSKKPASKDAAPAATLGPESERANELIKSGLRAILAISQLEESVATSRKWSDFVERVRKNEANAGFITALESERSFESV